MVIFYTLSIFFMLVLVGHIVVLKLEQIKLRKYWKNNTAPIKRAEGSNHGSILPVAARNAGLGNRGSGNLRGSYPDSEDD